MARHLGVQRQLLAERMKYLNILTSDVPYRQSLLLLEVGRYLPIAVIAYELHEHAPNTPKVLVYLIVGVGAFVGAFLLNELISRIPILRWCVLGIGKEKDHVSR